MKNFLIFEIQVVMNIKHRKIAIYLGLFTTRDNPCLWINRFGTNVMHLWRKRHAQQPGNYKCLDCATTYPIAPRTGEGICSRNLHPLS
jgi:hypothetical protein